MKKKIISILLVISVISLFTGCKEKKEDNNINNDTDKITMITNSYGDNYGEYPSDIEFIEYDDANPDKIRIKEPVLGKAADITPVKVQIKHLSQDSIDDSTLEKEGVEIVGNVYEVSFIDENGNQIEAKYPKLAITNGENIYGAYGEDSDNIPAVKIKCNQEYLKQLGLNINNIKDLYHSYYHPLYRIRNTNGIICVST